jgi:hypothetical protein
MDDAAILDSLFGLTLLTQRRQLRLELLELVDPRIDVGNMLVDQRVDRTAAAGWGVGEARSTWRAV